MNLLKSDFLKRWHKSLSKKFNWYHRWEKYKYSQRLHLSFFFIFLLIIAVSVILPYNPFSSKAINPLVPQAPKYLQANPGDGLMGLTWFWDDKEDVYKSRYEISYLRYPSLAEVPRDPNNKDRCNPSPSQKTTPAGVISNSSNPYTFRATNITGLNNNYYYCFYVQAKSTPSSAPAWTVASNPASPRAINKNNPTEFKQSPIGSPLILMVSDTANFYEVKSGNGELYPGSNVAKYPIQDPAREFDPKYTREQRLDAALENLLVYKDQDGNPKDWMFDSILLAPYDFVNGNWSRKDPTKENIDKQLIISFLVLRQALPDS
jgi:hypothetical protein